MLIGALLAPMLAAAGCSGPSHQAPNGAELRLERRQLLLVAEGLRSAQPAAMREVQASHAAWRLISRGLPASPSLRLRKLVRSARRSASQLVQPQFMANTMRLTGPAAGLASLYEAFARLADRGWTLTEASIASIVGRSRTAARFAQANSSLYIDAIYDAHFDLSLAGKSILDAYKRLGGERAFGTRLTLSAAHALARAYSSHALRLAPHPTAQ